MADYVYQAYPKAVYTKTDDGITHCVVNSPKELKALGSGWQNPQRIYRVRSVRRQKRNQEQSGES